MRIIAIGLGGAGCRIVDRLYSADHKSSRVACVQPLAVDIDEPALRELMDLPEKNKICFASIDSGLPGNINPTGGSATIDIAEIVSHVHNFESGETDAILLCMGLGGSMADVAPHIISGLRSTIREPIFGLVTLPCLAEGEKRSAQAADQIDILTTLLDGMILFDNETWYKKTKALKVPEKPKGKSLVHILGLAKPEPELSPVHATYFLLNDAIVRRISLILKAGEFKADGGIDLAEVVLDSGEVLNTMKGMGFITIGYAVERLPNNPLAFLSQFRPQGVFDEENKKKASRIVDLAKQAIYHEVSTPCDMTSAHKALVLIAGPSQELSMKGFMTVRKWIDRSIAGLETRSGDYPVVNTKNVAIIIMLSGLENIPRISELREIRAQHHAWADRQTSKGEGLPDNSISHEASGSIRDEMIVLPARMKKEEQGAPVSERVADAGVQPQIHQVSPPELRERSTEQVILEPSQKPAHPAIQKSAGESVHSPEHQETMIITPDDSPSRQTRHRVVVSGDTKKPSASATPDMSKKPSAPFEIRQSASDHAGKSSGELPKVSLPRMPPASADKDTSRQRIELELQRQRLKAMAGRGKIQEQVSPDPKTEQEAPVKKPHVIRAKPAIASTVPKEDVAAAPEPDQKRVIISRRKQVIRHQEDPVAEPSYEDQLPDDRKGPLRGESLQETGDSEDSSITIRDVPYRAKDRIFEGKGVQKSKSILTKDDSLLHTPLKQKKTSQGVPPDKDEDTDSNDPDDMEVSERTNDKKGKRPGDLSWI